MALCNHTSVGVIVIREGKYLLFDRQRYPFYKAPPAGHVDELGGLPIGTGTGQEAAIYASAGVREVEEEVGLRIDHSELTLVRVVRASNACRRKTFDADEHWHLWYVYVAHVSDDQRPVGNDTETKNLAWYQAEELGLLPDLEPVWRDHFERLGII